MKCKICGKELKVVNNAHLAAHDLSIAEYEAMFPGVDRYDPDVRKRMGEAIGIAQTGKKKSALAKKHMSDTRKAKIASGEIITPFMTMERTGENNPAWGSKYKTKEEIHELKERTSRIHSERVLNGKLASSYSHGKFFSTKNNKEFLYRSSYELRMFDILENLDCVRSYNYESIRIPYVMDDAIHHYIPDFLVEFIDDTLVLIEVGPATFKVYRDRKTFLKQEAAISYCATNDIEFVIVTKEVLDKLEDTANWVNCWEDLKPFCYNVTRNGKRDSLKKRGYVVNQQPSS